MGCHVMGFGQPSGFTSEADTPLLTGVGCEACHGPSGPHDGVRQDPRESCAACHDEKHSIQFSLAKGLPLIDHFKANGLSEEAFRTGRMELLDGEAPRPLLAFDTSATAGADACQSCHPDQVAQWKASPHANAMGRLEPEQSKQVGCVKCHATPSHGGPRPTQLSDYRIDESEGCETCHGPATKHIESKGAAGTIEGLGDDCPVCVIEAVCTSCHTKEQSPTFDVEAWLPKVKHSKTLPKKTSD